MKKKIQYHEITEPFSFDLASGSNDFCNIIRTALAK